MTSQHIACACGDEYPANSFGAGFMVANNGVRENCAAAEAGVQAESTAIDAQCARMRKLLEAVIEPGANVLTGDLRQRIERELEKHP